MSTRGAILGACLVFAACAPHFRPTHERGPLLDPPRVEVLRAELSYSNVYLLRGTGVVLVDAGSPSDVSATTGALAEAGLRPSDVKAVVLTHGHGDHAGMASFFQKQGAKIVLGLGDEPQAAKGQNDEMTPTSLFARVLRPFVRLDYEPFTPDVVVERELDLSSYGVDGVRVRRMPGHTRGSLVVLVGGREAIVGDQMLGGIFGGAFHGRAAGEHYYQLDPSQNRCNVQALLDEGIDRFHLGHGGPVGRDAVLAWAKSWPVTEASAGGEVCDDPRRH